MPWNDVMGKYKAGTLKSGGSGKPVKSHTQAVAIMLSEKRAAQGGKAEYQAKHRTAMGRKVIHHSPDQHPAQDDPMTTYTVFQQDMARPPRVQPGLKMGKSYTSPTEADKAIEELKKSNPGSVIYRRKGGRA